jgi:glycosyltransferase involved in cell wall biosynthesis
MSIPCVTPQVREHAMTADLEKSNLHVTMLGLRSISGAQGGIETHVRKLAEELTERGCKITVLERARYAHSPCAVRGVDRISLWSPKSPSLETIIHSLIGVIYAGVRRPEILHLHGIGPGLYAPLARMLGLKVVVTHHGEDYNREKWGPVARFVLRLGELASGTAGAALICVGPHTCIRLAEQGRDNVVHIPNGVKKVGEVAPNLNVLDELALEPGRFLICVGRLVPEKRQLDLIRAFGRLPKSRKQWRLVLVGGADHESGYSRQVESEGRNNSQIVLAGMRTPNELAALYEAATAFALVSSHEGLPIVMLEAMSYGKLIVASDIPANRSLDLPEECYVPLGNVDQIVRRLEVVMDQYDAGTKPDWSAYLGRYDWSNIADETKAIYKKVSNGSMHDH